MSLSRIEELLEMINNKSGPTDMIPLSRTEEILKCYINGISYTGPITSRFEELLYNTLYKQPSDEQPLSRSEEILKSKIDKTTYEGAILSRVEELLLEFKTEPDPVEITIGPDTILHVLNAIEAAAVSLKIDLAPTQDGTPWISDTLNTEPYLSRAAQNGNTADETIVGGTVAWNQLIPNRTFTNTKNTDTRGYIWLFFRLGYSPYTTFWSKVFSEAMRVETIANASVTGTARIIHNGDTRNLNFVSNLSVISGHKYLLSMDFTGVDLAVIGGTTVDDMMLIDLTQMFGSAIADYAYSLETSEAGSGIAWLRSHGFFTEDYYPYNKGELISAKPTAKTVGATTYTLGGADLRGLFKLDANNNLYCDGDVYTSDGTVTRRFGADNLGNLTWTAVTMSNNRIAYYASQSEMMGKPLFDTMNITIQNVIQYGTDFTWAYQYQSSWAVNSIVFTRTAGILPSNSLGIITNTGDYNNAEAFKSAMTNKYLVYELATPTTEQSTAYTNPQKAGEAEAFVDARTEKVPVGHSTRYSAEYAINGFEGVTVHVSETQTGGTTYPVTFTSHGTVYGGTVDVVSGELKITWGYIASYNGETLPGVWMSSKEVYVEGTSPSLGAEVSYILSTPITATIDPTTINISEGESYVWAEEGNSTLTYMGIPVTRKRSK